MNQEPVTLLYWIIPMLSGILCGVIGYLLGRGPMGPAALRNEAGALKAANKKLRRELDSCMDRLASARSQGISRALPFDAAAARKAFGKTIRQDDLTLIEGIGPKIVGLFQNFDIHTWKELSEASVAKCQEVLDSGGERYKLHDPSSWPMQARMAYEGKWKELARWQREHLHGKL